LSRASTWRRLIGYAPGVNKLFAALTGVFFAVIPSPAATNAVPATAGRTNDAATVELQRLMEDDDATLDEVDQWIRDNNAFVAKGGGLSKDELNKRIRPRLDSIRKRYQDFLRRYPTNAPAHLAYGTFLDDIGEEELGVAEFETARKLDPKDAAAWNNCANFYGAHGSPTNAFALYTEAIRLKPDEPVYYQNFATTVYLFRKDAREYYGIDEARVFDKALELYRKAIQLDPANFALVTDYAESYYGIKPLRTNDALISWTNALKVASSENEREAVYIHLARIKMAIGRYPEAHAHLAAVTNGFYDALKQRLERNLAEREHPDTNRVETTTNTVSPANPTGK